MSSCLVLTITVALVVGAAIATLRFQRNLFFPMILVTATLAAVDSHRIGFRRYKSLIAGGPLITFLGVLFLWILVFPWYLILRIKIREGSLPLKPDGVVPRMPGEPGQR